ncbi:MAG: hypothetical protein AAF518_17735 [Spirochaetota bacterium]
MAELTLGIQGYGFKVIAGPVHFGFYTEGGREIGLKHGYLGISSSQDITLIANLFENARPNQYIPGRKKSKYQRFYSSSKPDKTDPSYHWRFGIVGGLHGRFRVVVNPMEIFDFSLGFLGIDVFRDDVFSQAHNPNIALMKSAMNPDYNRDYSSHELIQKDANPYWIDSELMLDQKFAQKPAIMYLAEEHPNNKSVNTINLIRVLQIPRKNFKDQLWDERAFHTYLKSYSLETYVIKLFVKRGISEKAMKPALYLAMQTDTQLAPSMIKFLVKNGADINYHKQNYAKDNPLRRAAVYGNIKQTQVLLDLGANKNIGRSDTYSLTAFIRNRYNDVKFLLDKQNKKIHNCRKNFNKQSICNKYEEEANHYGWKKKLQEYRKILKLLEANDSNK